MLNNDMIGLLVTQILKHIIISYFTLKYYLICFL